MANIYKESQVTDVANAVTTSDNNFTKTTITPIRQSLSSASKYYESKQREYESKAERSMKLYEQGMQNLTNSSMKQIYESNKNNPMQLSDELDQMSQDIIDPIQDEETKVRIKTNFLLNKDAYMNSAKHNLDQTQKALMQQRQQEDLYNNIDLMNTALENILSPESDGTGFSSYKIAEARVNDILSQKNENGLYKYSVAQQRSMRDNIYKNKVAGVQQYYLGLSDEDKKKFKEEYLTGGQIAEFLGEKGVKEITNLVNGYTATKEKNAYLDPLEAEEKAIKNQVALLDIKSDASSIYDSKNKLREDVKFGDLVALRNKIQQYAQDGTISQKEYTQQISKTVYPLMEKAKGFDESSWFTSSNLQKAYNAVLRTADNKEITNLSAGEKAYLLTELYNQMSQKNINPDEWGIGTPNGLAEVAQKVQKDYLTNRDNALLTTNIDRVILGSDVFNFTEGKAQTKLPSQDTKVYKDPQGRLHRVYFENGQPVQSVLIK